MWPTIFRKAGSGDRTERLLQAILEQNALLRASLTAQGVSLPPIPSVPSTPSRKRTERDVHVVTRDDHLQYEIERELDLAHPDRVTARTESPR